MRGKNMRMWNEGYQMTNLGRMGDVGAIHELPLQFPTPQQAGEISRCKGYVVRCQNHRHGRGVRD